jgi:hypothetical protein
MLGLVDQSHLIVEAFNERILQASRVSIRLSEGTRSCSFSGERIAATTFQPSTAKTFAASFPITLEARVMSIVFTMKNFLGA